MSRYAGKVRIGVIAIFCAVALAIVGLHRFSGRAYSADATPTLLVTDGCSKAVMAYPVASNGDVSPLAPAPSGPFSPVATKNSECAEKSGVFGFTDAISPACLSSCDRSFLGLSADSVVGRLWS
jgi:hypothetical protein